MDDPYVELCFWIYVHGIWKMKDAPTEIVKNPELLKILKNIDYMEISESEHYSYDRFWDMVRTKKTLIADSFEEGFQKGLEEGRKIRKAQVMLADGVPLDKVIQYTGLTKEQIVK